MAKIQDIAKVSEETVDILKAGHDLRQEIQHADNFKVLDALYPKVQSLVMVHNVEYRLTLGCFYVASKKIYDNQPNDKNKISQAKLANRYGLTQSMLSQVYNAIDSDGVETYLKRIAKAEIDLKGNSLTVKAEGKKQAARDLEKSGKLLINKLFNIFMACDKLDKKEEGQGLKIKTAIRDYGKKLLASVFDTPPIKSDTKKKRTTKKVETSVDAAAQ